MGFAADAAAFPDSTGTTVEVYVRVRPNLIADLTREGRDPQPIQLQATLKPLFGACGIHEVDSDVAFPLAAGVELLLRRVAREEGYTRTRLRWTLY